MQPVLSRMKVLSWYGQLLGADPFHWAPSPLACKLSQRLPSCCMVMRRSSTQLRAIRISPKDLRWRQQKDFMVAMGRGQRMPLLEILYHQQNPKPGSHSSKKQFVEMNREISGDVRYRQIFHPGLRRNSLNLRHPTKKAEL